MDMVTGPIFPVMLVLDYNMFAEAQIDEKAWNLIFYKYLLF